MKKSIYIVGILGLVFILNGCNNKKDNNQDGNNLESAKEDFIKNENRESMADSTTDERIESDNVLKKNNETDLSVKLGEIKNDSNKIDIEEKDIEECDEGFIYNTQLKKCFENGKVDELNDKNKVEIDSVVKDCNDKGGIYNAQVEKCFID